MLWMISSLQIERALHFRSQHAICSSLTYWVRPWHLKALGYLCFQRCWWPARWWFCMIVEMTSMLVFGFVLDFLYQYWRWTIGWIFDADLFLQLHKLEFHGWNFKLSKPRVSKKHEQLRNCSKTNQIKSFQNSLRLLIQWLPPPPRSLTAHPWKVPFLIGKDRLLTTILLLVVFVVKRWWFPIMSSCQPRLRCLWNIAGRRGITSGIPSGCTNGWDPGLWLIRLEWLVRVVSGKPEVNRNYIFL